MKPIVTLVTTHICCSPRKAGFHWIAKALDEAGWSVNMYTLLHGIDIARNDYRVRRFPFRSAGLRCYTEGNISQTVEYQLLRPLRMGWRFPELVQSKCLPLFTWRVPKYLKQLISESDVVIFESCWAIAYAKTLKRQYPETRFVYRVSDDLETKPVPFAFVRAERSALSSFDKISYPNISMRYKFHGFSQSELVTHGVDTRILDSVNGTPYTDGKIHIVFFGANFLDTEFITVASEQFPHFQFEIIGPFEDNIKKPNVIFHGEMEFVVALPYVKYADIALNTLGRDGFSGSNKDYIYTYYKLPIVSSSKPLVCDKNVVYIERVSSEQVVNAINAALDIKKRFSPAFNVIDWSFVANSLVEI